MAKFRCGGTKVRPTLIHSHSMIISSIPQTPCHRPSPRSGREKGERREERERERREKGDREKRREERERRESETRREGEKG